MTSVTSGINAIYVTDRAHCFIAANRSRSSSCSLLLFDSKNFSLGFLIRNIVRTWFTCFKVRELSAQCTFLKNVHTQHSFIDEHFFKDPQDMGELTISSETSVPCVIVSIWLPQHTQPPSNVIESRFQWFETNCSSNWVHNVTLLISCNLKLRGYEHEKHLVAHLVLIGRNKR